MGDMTYTLEDSSTSLDITSYITGMKTGLPEGIYSMEDHIGTGGLIRGTGQLKGRAMSITRQFVGSQEQERADWIEFFTKPAYETINLRRNSSNFNGITPVKISMSGGEDYSVRNFVHSGDVEFSILAKDPYFYSTSQSSTTIAITSTNKETGTFTLAGARNYVEFLFTSSTSSITKFEVKTANDYGFQYNNAVAQGSTISVSTTGGDLVAEVDGSRTDGFFSSESNPVEMNSSDNTLYIIASTGTVTINYYERNL